MKQDGSNPHRVKVWTRGHMKNNGEPTNSEVAATFEELDRVTLEMGEGAFQKDVDKDALTKTLGPERDGRVRGFGCGVTSTTLRITEQRRTSTIQLEKKIEHMDDQMNELRQMVLLLMRNQAQCQQNENVPQTDLASSLNVRSNTNDNEGMFQTKLPSTSHVKSKDNNENALQTKLPFSSNVKSKGNTKRIHQTKLTSSSNAQSKVSVECDKCQLIDWTGTNEVVASGRIALVEPTTILHHVQTWSSCHDGMGRFFGESRSILMETYIRHVDNEGCFWQFSCMAY